jgi:hypothetical protein
LIQLLLFMAWVISHSGLASSVAVLIILAGLLCGTFLGTFLGD